MKKAVLGAALALTGAATTNAAMAQSQVTIYGVVDSGLVYTTNSNAAGDSVVKVPGLRTTSFTSHCEAAGSGRSIDGGW